MGATMQVETGTDGKKQVKVHYVNTPVPCVVEEKFGGYYHDHDDFALAEVLQDQETVYQSLQRNSQIDVPRASSSTNSRPSHDHGQNRQQGNSSATLSVESQLAIDEVLARELQEVEYKLAATSVGETADSETDTSSAESSTGNGEGSSAGTSTQAAREDTVDPDNMTYEELRSLTESVGTESRGLSEELIAYLTSSTYKTGLFSKKEKHEDCELISLEHNHQSSNLKNTDTGTKDYLVRSNPIKNSSTYRESLHGCVICYMAYKNRDKLITLPCQHQYHKACITRWLKINKACPVCNEEVFG